jgi:hypothetical protein
MDLTSGNCFSPLKRGLSSETGLNQFPQKSEWFKMCEKQGRNVGFCLDRVPTGRFTVENGMLSKRRLIAQSLGSFQPGMGTPNARVADPITQFIVVVSPSCRDIGSFGRKRHYIKLNLRET